MLVDTGRRGDGRVIARGIEICHGRWRRRLLHDLLNCFAMFCFVLNGEYHCYLCVRTAETPPMRGVCDSYCNCTPIVVNKICFKQTVSKSSKPFHCIEQCGVNLFRALPMNLTRNIFGDYTNISTTFLNGSGVNNNFAQVTFFPATYIKGLLAYLQLSEKFFLCHKAQ